MVPETVMHGARRLQAEQQRARLLEGAAAAAEAAQAEVAAAEARAAEALEAARKELREVPKCTFCCRCAGGNGMRIRENGRK